MKFTVERIYNGYLITDLQPHGEIREHVPDFLGVLKKLANCAFIANCPDVQIFGSGEFKHQFRAHCENGWNTPETGFQYGILDPERWESSRQKFKRELNNYNSEDKVYAKPAETLKNKVKEAEFQWGSQGMRKTKKFLIPKEELEEMRRKVADIKENKNP